MAGLGGDVAVLLLLRADDGVLRPEARYPDGLIPSDALRAAATAVAEKGKPATRTGQGGRVSLAVAVRTADDVIGVAGVDLALSDGATVADALRQLQWGATGLAAQMVAAPPSEAQNPEVGQQALTLMARALETRGYRDALRAAATEAATLYGAGRVAVARNRRRGARIEAISHAAEFRPASRASDLLAAAADAALDQRTVLVWPALPEDPPLAIQPLEALARETGAGSVLALPMGPPEAAWGAMVAEFRGAAEARAAAMPLDVAGEALAPLLEVKRRDGRWWIMRAIEGAGAALARLLGPRALGWKALAIFVLALVIAAATVRAPHRVTADAEISAEGRVLVSAPFDGFLAERLVRAGDRVSTGDILVTMDDRELLLERLRHEATRAQRRIELDAAVAVQDRARMSVLAAEIAETEARLALTEAQLEAGRIRAPFDGIVAGDATEGRVGAPLGRGEELLSLAPLDAFTVTLHVPDQRVEVVSPGQDAVVRLAAIPEEGLPVVLERVTPMTEARDGENTFRAVARLDGAPPAGLAHGMEGIAKITVGEGLWVSSWAGPLWEQLRLRLWGLWP